MKKEKHIIELCINGVAKRLFDQEFANKEIIETVNKVRDRYFYRGFVLGGSAYLILDIIKDKLLR